MRESHGKRGTHGIFLVVAAGAAALFVNNTNVKQASRTCRGSAYALLIDDRLGKLDREREVRTPSLWKELNAALVLDPDVLPGLKYPFVSGLLIQG